MTTLNILTSPIINGTPRGNGIQTITLKNGTGAGNYTYSTDTNYADVDATNLVHVTFIPRGWNLTIFAHGSMTNTSVAATVFVGLFIDTEVVTAVPYQETTAGNVAPWALHWTIGGVDSTHLVKLQFKTSSTLSPAVISNGATGNRPSMLFILQPTRE